MRCQSRSSCSRVRFFVSLQNWRPRSFFEKKAKWYTAGINFNGINPDAFIAFLSNAQLVSKAVAVLKEKATDAKKGSKEDTQAAMCN